MVVIPVDVADVRDTLIQALGLVVCYPASLTALESVNLERSVSVHKYNKYERYYRP